MRKLSKFQRRLAAAVALTSVPLIAPFLYLAGWMLWYRMPAGAPEIVDLRIHSTEQPHFVILCAALADKWHGFPGHCYVSWSDQLPINVLQADSVGYVPARVSDAVPSLWREVDGLMVDHADVGNRRNLDMLITVVDLDAYKRTHKLAHTWNRSRFQTGVCDCVCFVNDIATDLGLNVPPRKYRFPQDYIREIKALNRGRASTTTLSAFKQAVEKPAVR
jgi:hypothetical protein